MKLSKNALCFLLVAFITGGCSGSSLKELIYERSLEHDIYHGDNRDRSFGFYTDLIGYKVSVAIVYRDGEIEDLNIRFPNNPPILLDGFTLIRNELFQEYELQSTYIIIEGVSIYGDSLWCDDSNVYCFRFEYELNEECYRLDYRYDGTDSVVEIYNRRQKCSEGKL